MTRIVVDSTGTSAPSDIAYKTIIGRAFGELAPDDPHNALITDIGIAPRNANGNVEYFSSASLSSGCPTFTITMPTDPTQASGVVWHDVPNRGGKVSLTSDLKGVHDIELDSGWQGDNAGATAVPANAASLSPITPVNTAPVMTSTRS